MATQYEDASESEDDQVTSDFNTIEDNIKTSYKMTELIEKMRAKRKNKIAKGTD